MQVTSKKLFLALVVPAAVFALFEGILRFVGIGHETDFLVSCEVNGEPVWVENPFFTYTMFDPALARTPPAIVANKKKPDDLFRVVVLGESAAMGDPIPDFGVPRVLEFSLRHADPGARVEVINAAITAINSHAIKDVALDLDKLEPDLVIVYAGNNEVIGPYGPGTTFSRFFSSDLLVDIIHRANRLRISQMIRQWFALLRDQHKAQDFGGVGMFIDNPVSASDTRLEAVRRRFEKNMRLIINSSLESGARVLVSTVAVNLEACPPTISTHRPGINDAELAQWQKYVDHGVRLAELNSWPEALMAFEAAAEIDDQHAALNYWLATSFRETGRDEEARDYFSRAMNLDAFRYRTDSTLNDIIRKVARSMGENVVLVDAAADFEDTAGSNDEELFVDHVHFSLEGTAKLAAIWMGAIDLMPSSGAWTNRNGPPATGWLRNEMVYKTVAEISVVQEMARRFAKPPFTLQLNYKHRLRALQEKAARLNEQLRTEGGDEVALDYRDRLTRYPDDLYFPMHLAQHLITLNRYASAKPVADAAIRKHPHRRGPRSVMAHLLAIEGRASEAAGVLLDYKMKHGYFAAVSSTYLLSVLTSAGFYDEAVAVVEALGKKAGTLDYRHRILNQLRAVRSWRDHYASARAYVTAGNLAAAEKLFSELNRSRPDLGEPLAWLGIIQGMRGWPEKGFPLFRQALERMNYLQAHYYGGLWQARSERFEDARAYFEKVSSLANDDVRFVNSLAWIYIADPREELRDPSKALKLLTSFAEKRPQSTPAIIFDTQAALLAGLGNFTDAMLLAERARLLAAEEGNNLLANEIQQRLEKYRIGTTAFWGNENGPFVYF